MIKKLLLINWFGLDIMEKRNCLWRQDMNERLEINPNEIYPVKGIKSVTYVKPTIKNPNIIVGEFTYFSDEDFENHVTHHYDFMEINL